MSCDSHRYIIRQEDMREKDVQYLVALQLPKLKSLELECCDVLPLAHGNWPVLTKLSLTLDARRECLLDPVFPADLQFPRWPLKSLALFVRSSRVAKHKPGSMSFLGPLLKSCREVTHLHAEHYDGIEEEILTEMATTIASASLPQLTSLNLGDGDCSKFFEIFIDGNWPKLKKFVACLIGGSLLHFITPQIWLRDLESLDMFVNEDATAEQLRAFLQAIHSCTMKKLTLGYLPFSAYSEFKGIRLDYLKLLDLRTPEEYGDGVDVSSQINLLFDTCYFPELEEIKFGDSNCQETPDTMPKWVKPPNTSVRALSTSFPNLRNIGLFQMNISRDVADYLGQFREQTGCELEIVCHIDYICYIEEVPLSANRQCLFNKLDIDLEEWKELC